MRLAPLALAAALALAAPLAAAQTIDASDPRPIVKAVQDAGYRATLGKDGGGDPMIESALDGTEFVIQFFGCKDNRACKYIVFRASFDVELPFEAINEWNADQLVGTLYGKADGRVGMDYFVTLDGGVSRANLLDAIDWWRLAVTEFNKKTR
jgi:hypothetical protein